MKQDVLDVLSRVGYQRETFGSKKNFTRKEQNMIAKESPFLNETICS